MPNKTHLTDPKTRGIVEAMAAYGVPQHAIAETLGISEPTLRKHYAQEIAHAQIKANAKVAETCFKMATSGKVPAATFFWLKTRAGWKESERGPVDETLSPEPPATTPIRKLVRAA